jgi:hypothetical protein
LEGTSESKEEDDAGMKIRIGMKQMEFIFCIFFIGLSVATRLEEAFLLPN